MTGIPTVPACSCCRSVGLKTNLGDLIVDGRIKAAGGGRAAAWVTCHKVVGPRMICGWGWWSVHPLLLRMARRHPNRRLLRRHAKAPGHPGRRGKG